MADFDDDGIPDLATANYNSDDLSVLLGNGDGTFQAAVVLDAGDLPHFVIGADLDGDFRPELIAANTGNDSVLVFFSRSDVPPEIDIRPGNSRNQINPSSRGRISVAILGSDTCDVSEVLPQELAFGPNRAEPAHRSCGRFRDTNRDGITDLVSCFRTAETGIAFGDTEACIVGELLDGTHFESCDYVDTATGVGCGIGFELALLLAPVLWLRSQRRSRGCRAF